jgi:hypothetical protein
MSGHALHTHESSSPKPESGESAPTEGAVDDILTVPELQFFFRAAGAGLHAVDEQGCVNLVEELTPNIPLPASVRVTGDMGFAEVVLDPMSTAGERADMLQQAEELKAHLAQEAAK